jgi:hypothetical protein
VALVALPQYLRFLVGSVPASVGLAGILAGVTLAYRASLLLLGLAAVGILTFLALGLFGLPLLDRYLLVPAIVLALFCGVAVAGWERYRGPQLARRCWMTVGIALGAVLLASGPVTAREIRDSDRSAARRARVQADLESTLRNPHVRRAVLACPLVFVPDYRAVPLVIEALALPSRDVRIGSMPSRVSGVRLSYASISALDYFGTGSAIGRVSPHVIRGGERVSATRYWLADVRCAEK